MIVGIKGADGRVHLPPAEYDPYTGEDLTELVEVGPGGTVTSWSWVGTPHDKHPLDQPFAWALIQLDGADTSMLHAVDAGAPTGRPPAPGSARWADEREGHITDIECFDLEEA